MKNSTPCYYSYSLQSGNWPAVMVTGEAALRSRVYRIGWEAVPQRNTEHTCSYYNKPIEISALTSLFLNSSYILYHITYFRFHKKILLTFATLIKWSEVRPTASLPRVQCPGALS